MGGQDLGVMDPPVLRWDDRRGLSLPNPAEGGHGQSQDGGSPDALLRAGSLRFRYANDRCQALWGVTMIRITMGAAGRSVEGTLFVVLVGT